MEPTRVSKAADLVATQAKDVGSSLASSSRDLLDWTTSQVRDRPYHALGVAALMGLLGWTAWSRRGSGRDRWFR